MLTDEQKIIIKKTKIYVNEKLSGEGSGHDFFHAERVLKTSLHICKIENADEYIVSLSALLHDIDDWKFSSDNKTNTENIRAFLKSVNADDITINKVTGIIKTLSYKGGVTDSSQSSLEGKIVQDADRLDAIGAIGIARTFTYGGSRHQTIYDPPIKPVQYFTLSQVKNEKNHTINHFYEKLLKLKDLMNTNEGKRLAIKRHDYMKDFLEEFYREWNCDY